MLYLALHLAYLILQLPARALEGIVERVVDVRITLVVLGRTADIDLAAFRQGEVNRDLVESTGAVMATRRAFTTTRPAVIRPERSSSCATCLSISARMSGLASMP